MTLLDDTIRRLGISGIYLGYKYLKIALELAVEDEDRLLRVTKLIYPQIAQELNTNTACVQKNLRTVINVCWNGSGRKHLEDMCGYRLSMEPSIGEFLDIVSSYLRKLASENELVGTDGRK